METRDVLLDAFGRIVEDFEAALADLTPDQLVERLDPQANSICWLAWHATRVQDDHVAHLAGVDQAWTEDGFERRFDLGVDPSDIGYGHTSDEVAAVRVDDPQLLVDYLRAVTGRTNAYLAGVDAAELDRVIDRHWDPPVTVGVRLVSVIDDCMQHAGQARFIRGVLERRG